jgi:hypothetical protein
MVKKGSTVYVIYDLRGGLMQGLDFTDLNARIDMEDRGAPLGHKWQRTKYGVNLVG